MVPHTTQTAEKRPLGLLSGKATVIFTNSFKVTEEALID